MKSNLLLNLLLAVAASANVNLEVQLFYKDVLEDTLTESDSSKVHLCLQPAHTILQPLHCPYGEFLVSDITSTVQKHGHGTFHFLDFWPKGDIQLLIHVFTKNSQGGTVVTIPFPKTLSFIDGLSNIQAYEADKTEFGVRYKISSTCKPNSFGEQCNFKCIPPSQKTDGCKATCNYLGEVICLYKEPAQTETQSEGVLQRLRRQQPNNSGGLDSNTVLIVCVVTIVGGYLILVTTFILILVLCFVRCDRKTCRPKVTRKPCSSDAAQLCCERCADACCDDDYNISFWVTIIAIIVLCFPFGLCFLVLYALGNTN